MDEKIKNKLKLKIFNKNVFQTAKIIEFEFYYKKNEIEISQVVKFHLG